jgi:hypothetical protein
MSTSFADVLRSLPIDSQVRLEVESSRENGMAMGYLGYVIEVGHDNVWFFSGRSLTLDLRDIHKVEIVNPTFKLRSR